MWYGFLNKQYHLSKSEGIFFLVIEFAVLHKALHAYQK